MSTVDALTDAERDTLSQLQAITNGADVDTQISLLQSVDWDLPVSSEQCVGHDAPCLFADRNSLGRASGYIWR